MNNALINNTFNAHGKLLITAEYLVLHGATALTIPLKFGQTLTVESSSNKELFWIAYMPNGLWFSATFDKNLNILIASDKNLAHKLQNILLQALQIGGFATEFLIGNKITTQLQFQPEWGFGSSSTLVSLISQWLKINPYQLLEATFGGSGYDVAAATNQKPIIYQHSPGSNPIIAEANFHPPFHKNLIFFYLGQKQTSSSEVVKYRDLKPKASLLKEINNLSKEIITCPTLDEFEQLLLFHEEIIGQYISKPSINKIINIPSATLKSLGAWGGDFALAATKNVEATKQFLHNQGYTVQFSFEELIY